MAALSHLGSKREALFPWISGQEAGLMATVSGKRRLLADEGDVLWRGQAGTGGRLIFGIASFMLSAAHGPPRSAGSPGQESGDWGLLARFGSVVPIGF